MKLTKRGGVFWVDFRAPDGRRRRISTTVPIPADKDQYAKAEAVAYKKAGEIVQQHMAAGAAPAEGEAPTEPTLGAILDRQQRTHWSRMSYGKVTGPVVGMLKRHMGHKPLSSVDYNFLKEYADEWIAKGKSPSTLNRRMAIIGKALREAVKLGELAKMPDLPHYSEKLYTRERYMEVEEEAKALEWFDKMAREDAKADQWQWEYMRHLTVFLLDTGFRFAEAFKFTVVDGCADLKHGATKNTIGRRVPLTTRAKRAAKYLLESAHHRWLDEHTTDAKPKTAWDWCAHRWERMTRALGLNVGYARRERLTFHILRHTFGSRLVQRGVDLYLVSKLMGHSDIRQTQRYAKFAPDSAAIALAALERRPVALSRNDATSRNDSLAHNNTALVRTLAEHGTRAARN